MSELSSPINDIRLQRQESLDLFHEQLVILPKNRRTTFKVFEKIKKGIDDEHMYAKMILELNCMEAQRLLQSV